MVWRVVLDTSVLVAALRSSLGASNALLGLVVQRHIIALATTPLFLEYEEVLRRPEHCLVHGLSQAEVSEFLMELAALIEPVETYFQWRPQLTDSSDEMVLEAAINGRADALVTHNMSDFAHAGKRFSIPVMRPADLLRRMAV
jgi:putative PIN family toxin of toxin-antitoxin system